VKINCALTSTSLAVPASAYVELPQWSVARQRPRRSSWGTALAVTLLLVGLAVVVARTLPRHTVSSATPTSTSAPRSTTSTSRPVSTTTFVPTSTAVTNVPWATPRTDEPTATGALSGDVIVLDPGHDGGNEAYPSVIAAPVPDGAGTKSCDTTGTATNDGYPEHRFTWLVALEADQLLTARGATVVLTRNTDTRVGPCVNTRGTLAAAVHAVVALSVHADGGPPGGRGFAVLVPAGVGPSATMVASARRLGATLVQAFMATGMPTSTYDGSNGIAVRSDLAGLNLSTVPKVLIECGNMRNATDATLLTDPTWQHQAALALANALTTYLTAQ
jgi:N-acetylmuramoyl-L-alanine amidase